MENIRTILIILAIGKVIPAIPRVACLCSSPFPRDKAGYKTSTAEATQTYKQEMNIFLMICRMRDIMDELIYRQLKIEHGMSKISTVTMSAKEIFSSEDQAFIRPMMSSVVNGIWLGDELGGFRVWVPTLGERKDAVFKLVRCHHAGPPFEGLDYSIRRVEGWLVI